MCMLSNAKAEFNRLTNSLIYHMRSEHEGGEKKQWRQMTGNLASPH